MSAVPAAVTPFEQLRRSTPEEQAEILVALTAPQKRELLDRWEGWAHGGQLPPAGDWRIWLIRAGRGFGKTRAGAEWVSAVARQNPEARIALVGATIADAERVMIDGASGLRSVAWDGEKVVWRVNAGEFVFPSGARAFIYSAEAPEALRGPEHHAAWCDELAKWRDGERAWDNLMMGLRLTELALQTSSYGTQIPKLFGTMRVAGTVIWSTDLIESSQTSHAKGQPSTTTFSYSASFAVLLSARPIRSIGRIWADGNLLRGAGGDFKAATGFRLHLGGEDQAADPLIASAENGLTPAHRGCAYAVFEGLALGDYGNRIPSLTFEVIADDGAVGAGTIAAAIAPEIDGGAGLPLIGFAASGGSVRAVLDTLGTAGGAWFATDGARLTMRDAATDAVTIADAGYAATAKGQRRARQVAAIETVPRTVTLSHYDPARDYQTGVQRASRPGAGARDDRVEMPAVLDAVDAKAMATAILARAETARTKRTVWVAHDAMALNAGVPVTIAGEDGVWRIATSTIEAMVTKLDLVPVITAPLSPTATSGRVRAAADHIAGRTMLTLFETPALDDAILTQPRISIAARGTGSGWRSAPIAYSIDDGASWIDAGSTAAPAIIGTVEAVPGTASSGLFDLGNTLIVRLTTDDAVLAEADAPAIDRGDNLALVGGELLQFGAAVPLSRNRWRLSRLSRGRRGTEASIGTQVAGDPFVLVTAGSVRTIDLPLARIGGTVRVMATGIDDGDGVVAAMTVGGQSIRPPSPVHLGGAIDAAGSATISWVRRSRGGWRWIDGVDAPIGEESEAYRVTLTDAAGAIRTVDTDRPMLVVAASDLASRPLRIAVRQRGTFGESDAAIMVLA